MITNAIARRYAKALVHLAADEGAVEKFNGELSQIATLLEASPELSAVFSNPAYGVEAKKEILKDVIGKAGLSTTVGNFLQLLLDRSRLAFLPQIAASYSVLSDELSGIIRPVLTSGMQLEAAQVEEIKTALARSTGKQVVLQVEVDPTLIGGVVTKIGDKVYDGSVRTQLNRIEDILQKG